MSTRDRSWRCWPGSCKDRCRNLQFYNLEPRLSVHAHPKWLGTGSWSTQRRCSCWDSNGRSCNGPHSISARHFSFNMNCPRNQYGLHVPKKVLIWTIRTIYFWNKTKNNIYIYIYICGPYGSYISEHKKQYMDHTDHICLVAKSIYGPHGPYISEKDQYMDHTNYISLGKIYIWTIHSISCLEYE